MSQQPGKAFAVECGDEMQPIVEAGSATLSAVNHRRLSDDKDENSPVFSWRDSASLNQDWKISICQDSLRPLGTVPIQEKCHKGTAHTIL
jgi:hypothetical protein